MASLSIKILLTQIPKLVRYLLPFEIYMYQNVQFHKVRSHLWYENCRNTCCFFCFAELSTRKTEFLFAATIILLLFSVLNLIVEGLQALSRRLDYLKEWDNYMQLTIPALTITFVISNKLHDCFCPSGPQWQLGSLVIFLAWFNFILLMRSVPFTAIPINMLFGITRSFLKVIVLPVLLITSFGIPLFLLLHQPVSYTICIF